MNIFSLFGALPGITMGIGLLLTPYMVKKFGKRHTLMLAVGEVALGNIIGSIMPRSFAFGLTGVMVKGLGSATVMCQLFTLAPDIVRYIEIKTGMRVEGLAASANSFGCKIGSGLGTAVVLWGLSASGYNADLTVQPAAAQTTFIALYWWVPALLSLVLLLLASGWDIDKFFKDDKNSAAAVTASAPAGDIPAQDGQTEGGSEHGDDVS